MSGVTTSSLSLLGYRRLSVKFLCFHSSFLCNFLLYRGLSLSYLASSFPFHNCYLSFSLYFIFFYFLSFSLLFSICISVEDKPKENNRNASIKRETQRKVKEKKCKPKECFKKIEEKRKQKRIIKKKKVSQGVKKKRL